MVSSRFTTAVALLSAAASSLAAPQPRPLGHISTHGKRAIAADGASIESYHPLATYESFGDGLQLESLLAAQTNDPSSLASAASTFLQTRLNIDQGSYQATHSAVTDTVTHVYLKQVINGIPVVNGVANVALKSGAKVASYGANFVKPSHVSSATPSITVDQALAAAEKQLSATRVADAPTSTEYFLTAQNEAVLVHVVQVQTANVANWFQAYVDAATGSVIGQVDFVAHASYKVLPIQKQDPREGLELLVDPEDLTASPSGWVIGGVTAGNNAVAYKGATSATGAQSSSGVFDYTYDDTKAPTDTTNVAAAKVNSFYVVNTIHDVAYKYGFTEKTFNFQNDNGSNGGKGNDRVTISVQDSGGTDNANFATPPDGQSGHMNMYIWDITNPKRDGDLENDIVSHEMTHGITNRMTGGGTGACLSTTEAGGMGEGWSDTMAFWLEQKDGGATKDFTLGTYVYNKNIRTHPYSTSKTTNPLTYASVATLNEVHNIGEVWANILLNVYSPLVEAHGWSATARTDPTGSEGNVVFLHLFLDALLLQPCSPTMLTARDAWIQADANRYAGANKCLLWKAFASRGLGQKAANHKDDATIPSDCGGTGSTTVAPTTTKASTTAAPTTTSKTTVASTTKASTTSTTPTKTPTPTPTPTNPPTDPDCPWWWPFC
jgi:extracellular elastinolytic metalloproteinase